MRVRFWLPVLFFGALAMHAQTGVGIEVDEVVDNRFSTVGAGALQLQGSLELRVNLTGKGLDKAVAARVIVTEAKDDKGNSLVGKSPRVPDFTGREYNSGTLQVSVGQPSREASTVRLKGTIELYVPSRDPGANVKIENALAKLDVPLSHKALKAAKIEITPLSKAGYEKLVAARKVTPEDIEKIKAQAKKEGATDEELEMVLGLAQALDTLQEPFTEGSVAFSGEKSDFDRIYRVEILGADGAPVNVPSRGTSTRGEASIMTLQPSEPPPASAVLHLMLLTDKSRVSFPFDLKVELP